MGDMKPGQTSLAIALVVTSALMFSLTDAIVKYLGALMSVALLLLARYGIQGMLAAAWLARTRGKPGFITRHPRFQLLRGVVMLVNTGLVVVCLRYMPLAEFTSIIMLSPIVVTAFAGWALKESIGRLRWALLCGGFLGTLLVVRPGDDLFSPVIALALLVMLGATAFSLISSHLAQLEDPYITQFYTGLIGSLLILPFVLLQVGTLPGLVDQLGWLPFTLLFITGVLGSVGHIALLKAFSRASAASLMPFTYTQIGFSAVLGWLVFNHTPDAWAWAGMITIATCGVMTAWLNSRRAIVAMAKLTAPEKLTA